MWKYFLTAAIKNRFMKKLSILMLCFFKTLIASSQPIPPKSIEDKVLNWKKIYNFKGVKKPLTVDNKIYSTAQLSICDTIANWMQSSYLPKGGWGDVRRFVSEKTGLYNKDDAAMPQSYGTCTTVYTQLKKDAQGKMALLTIDGIFWNIAANGSVGISARVICTPTKYYFTLPSFKDFRKSAESPQVISMTSHPNTKKYPAYLKRNENGMFDFGLMIYPENKFPFIKITKVEYLVQLEAAVERIYSFEKEEALTKWFTDASRASARKDVDDRYQKRLATLKNSRVKYKNDLTTVAEISTYEPDIHLEYYSDVFEGTGESLVKYPVYKIDPTVAENCKTDKPQWFMVTWNGGLNNTVGNTLHQSILNSFNFEFFYNFFFDHEKVKGQSYKPLRSPSN